MKRNIWKYIKKIPEIDVDKLNKKLKIVNKCISEKKLKNSDERKVALYCIFNTSKSDKKSVDFRATLVDILKLKHSVEFKDLKFAKFSNPFKRKMNVKCEQILIDGEKIICVDGNFNKPKYRRRMENFTQHLENESKVE